MKPHESGKASGRSASHAKRVAAKANGAKGGRPSKVALLLRRMREMHARLAGKVPEIDPHDLDLIVERLCRAPGDREFFIVPLAGGGYGF